MTRPRSEQIHLESTPYYHCISRCVRKAFLCGRTVERSYEHRRAWIEHQLLHISQYFMIDVVSYAVMNNHYHVILAVNQAGALALSDKEVIRRWHNLYQGTDVSANYLAGEKLSYEQEQLVKRLVNRWRERLYSLSWFMRCINEPISRWANKEDNCQGRFWEGRFKSQALLGEKALLACMSYVDLNPIRAKMAKSLEESDYTSIKKRMDTKACIDSLPGKHQPSLELSKALLPFKDEVDRQYHRHLDITFSQYLEIVEWSGRQIISNSKGYIEGDIPSLLDKYHFDISSWLYLSQYFKNPFKIFIGTLLELSKIGKHFNMKRIGGRPACRFLFGPD